MGGKHYLKRPTVQIWVHQTSNLFPKLKDPMSGKRLPPLEGLSTNVTQAMRHMNKSGVLDGIFMLHKRWGSVIEKRGDYIEGLWTDR